MYKVGKLDRVHGNIYINSYDPLTNRYCSYNFWLNTAAVTTLHTFNPLVPSLTPTVLALHACLLFLI